MLFCFRCAPAIHASTYHCDNYLCGPITTRQDDTNDSSTSPYPTPPTTTTPQDTINGPRNTERLIQAELLMRTRRNLNAETTHIMGPQHRTGQGSYEAHSWVPEWQSLSVGAPVKVFGETNKRRAVHYGRHDTTTTAWPNPTTMRLHSSASFTR